MRGTAVLLAALTTMILSGCASAPGGEDGDAGTATPAACDGALHEQTLYFGPGLRLQNATPEAGRQFSNGFDEAFLVDDMDEWRSDPLPQAMRVLGNVTVEFWVENDGTPAPYVVSGEPTEGYHWFNQFGSDRGFVEAYVQQNADAAPMPGDVHHFVHTFPMPAGGLHLEAGDQLRLLLTSLVLDDTQSTGQYILFGGDTPSSISFTSHCRAELAWEEIGRKQATVVLQGNQGLITGQVPATEGFNVATIPFTLDESTQRLTINIRQEDDTSPVKDDIDLTVLDADGEEVVGIGSPYADETGTFYAANLAAMMPPGDYAVRVDSYSGNAYRGELTVLQEIATLA